jgi:hypothetical protein
MRRGAVSKRTDLECADRGRTDLEFADRGRTDRGRTDLERTDLGRFLRGELDPRGFTHRDHVRMAYELLAREDFAHALVRYGAALRALLARIGRPDAFNQTVTVAYLAAIAECMQDQSPGSFEEFAAANPALFDKDFLQRWYAPERLYSTAARRIFLMPEPRGVRRRTAPRRRRRECSAR